jgi:hypothetical protein
VAFAVNASHLTPFSSANTSIFAPTRGFDFWKVCHVGNIGSIKHVEEDVLCVELSGRHAGGVEISRGVKLACDRAVAPILSGSTLH